MKKFLFIIMVIIGIGGGILFYTKSSPNISHTSVTPSPTTAITIPVRIAIPAINVQTTIEQVGLDSQKRMDIPKDPSDVGWYMYGVKPGEVGNAALDGHVDLPSGAPSVFANLTKLSPGDTIEITDASQITHTFLVEKKESFDAYQFPIQLVFGHSFEKRLNLITCAGTWDKNKHNYNQRLVVFSKLKE